MRRPRLILSCLLGSAILVGFAIASVPWSDGLRRPRTPFDRSRANMVAPGYALLSAAAAVIPPGASVVVRTEPADPTQETWYHRFAVAFLPGRRALPAAFYGRPAPREVWGGAQFIVVVGGRPAAAPGQLLLETPEGTVWRAGQP